MDFVVCNLYTLPHADGCRFDEKHTTRKIIFSRLFFVPYLCIQKMALSKDTIQSLEEKNGLADYVMIMMYTFLAIPLNFSYTDKKIEA